MKTKLFVLLTACFIFFSMVVTAPQQTEAAYSAKSTIKEAKKYTGTPYKWGGTTRAGFDCSGYLQYVHKKTGYSLPRTVAQMYKKGRAVSKSKLQPGDLVFFTTYKKGPSHAGIYLGSKKFIHASSSKGVSVAKLTDSYWKKRYIGARSLD